MTHSYPMFMRGVYRFIQSRLMPHEPHSTNIYSSSSLAGTRVKPTSSSRWSSSPVETSVNIWKIGKRQHPPLARLRSRSSRHWRFYTLKESATAISSRRFLFFYHTARIVTDTARLREEHSHGLHQPDLGQDSRFWNIQANEIYRLAHSLRDPRLYCT